MIAILEQFEESEAGLLVRAPAKLNLCLLITGKRPDGYHGIETVMAKINWYDELLFEKGRKEGIELVCRGNCWAPEGPENLIWRACEMLFERAGRRVPLKVTLTKNIPAGTGLGSASSDAAAAVMALNRFAKLGQTDRTLHEVCSQLGSDVNFFLGGPLAFCTGRGEKIEKIEKIFKFSALICVPDISVATKGVYANYHHDSKLYSKLSGQIMPLLSKKNLDSLARICANMLETSCFRLHPELKRLKDVCKKETGLSVCLSGSGSAVYVLADEMNARLLRLQERLKKEFNCESRFINNNSW
ncbi:MAG: 4-(cytidine 5'-diphospho)-2-C-methyl-D-erythritol kinase [Planctomycetaceae bacterium]|nr:4-(cytidine 5'-diphospho)-2-C-methyl-D-erythritol kinase [Planctomycetaceae bacterium]